MYFVLEKYIVCSFFQKPIFFLPICIANVMTIWFSKLSDCDLSREYWVLMAVSFLNCNLSTREMGVARILCCYYLLLRHLEIYRKLYLESSDADWGCTLRSRNLKRNFYLESFDADWQCMYVLVLGNRDVAIHAFYPDLTTI